MTGWSDRAPNVGVDELERFGGCLLVIFIEWQFLHLAFDAWFTK